MILRIKWPFGRGRNKEMAPPPREPNDFVDIEVPVNEWVFDHSYWERGHQELVKSVPFGFRSDRKPAIVLDTTQHVLLSKGYQAATTALSGLNVLGADMELIALVDDSDSMRKDFAANLVWELLRLLLGFSLNVDSDGEVPALAYSRHREPRHPVIHLRSYSNMQQIITPRFQSTPTAQTLALALSLAQTYDKLCVILDLTDGMPDSREAVKRQVIKASGLPVIIVEVALRPVSFHRELVRMPSRYSVEKYTGVHVRDERGQLRIVVDEYARRLFDNVHAFNFDPRTGNPELLASKIAEGIAERIELMGAIGLLQGVPGVDRQF